MEGSDFTTGMQNSIAKRVTRRVPDIGESVIFVGSHGFREGVVLAVAHDRDNEPSRAKVEWAGFLGIKRQDWVWIFDLHYLTNGKHD